MNLIILGPPGSGKGTQAKLLAQRLGITHISSGALLRQAAQSDPKLQTVLDSGQLVEFPIVLSVIQPQLTDSKGFILDGTPRNVEQAQYLDQFFQKKGVSIDRVILLELPDQDTVIRLLKRAQQENRTDDDQDTIMERIRIYHEQTQPVIQHYQAQGKLLRIDGSPDIQTILQDILSKLTG